MLTPQPPETLAIPAEKQLDQPALLHPGIIPRSLAPETLAMPAEKQLDQPALLHPGIIPRSLAPETLAMPAEKQLDQLVLVHPGIMPRSLAPVTPSMPVEKPLPPVNPGVMLSPVVHLFKLLIPSAPLTPALRETRAMPREGPV